MTLNKVVTLSTLERKISPPSGRREGSISSLQAFDLPPLGIRFALKYFTLAIRPCRGVRSEISLGRVLDEEV